MKRKLLSGLMLTLLLCILFSGYKIKPARSTWTGTVYIRADGSIDPPNVPITTYDNITYTLTDNITSSEDGIVVERDNILLDGAGHTLQGTEGPRSIGIGWSSVSNVTVKNINIKNFAKGIVLSNSSNNSISGNNLSNNNVRGIQLLSSSNNSISENNITAVSNGDGVEFYDSSYNSVFGNNITNNIGGVRLDSSSNYNVISGNIIINNRWYGIDLFKSSNNTLSGNNITNNNERGISLFGSSNNRFYHNNFIDNFQQVRSDGYANVWDDGYPSGGNYWSNYNGTDMFSGPYQNESGSDGIGDSEYTIDANNTDRYPLMAPFTAFDAGTWDMTSYNVDVISNSTVSDFQFDVDQKSVSFNITGDDGTAGFCRVTIPKSLLWVEDGWTITVGDQQVNYTVIPNENYSYLYFTYNHSTQTIVIQGTHIIPEFPSSVALLGFLTLLAIPLIFTRKKRYRKNKS